MKKYLLLLLAVTGFAQTNPTAFNKLRITQNIEDNLANRVVVQDPVTGELKWVLKSSLVPQANATTSGTVRTTTAETNPEVYTVAIANNLLNAKVDKTTTVNGQALSGNITIATGTVNSTDAQLRDRTTHTGVQAIATVTGLQTALDAKQASGDFATNTMVTNGLNTKINNSEKAVANGVATLGADGKIPNSQIPALAISETFPVTSQVEMLALSLAEQGDIAIRSDVSRAFILRQTPSSVLGNWSELLTPASSVTSVAGKVGAVVLNSGDVGLGNVPNTDFTSAVNLNTAKIGITTAQSNAIVANTAKTTNATHIGDATGATTLTLATVNANIGTFNNVVVNGKGLITSASNAQYATGTGSAINTNTGDNATNTQYSGLASSKANVTNPIFDGTGRFNSTSLNSTQQNNGLFMDYGSVISNFNGVTFRGRFFSDMYFGGNNNGDDLVIRNDTAELFRFTRNGNVGINQLEPTERLDVVGNGKFSGTTTNNNDIATSIKFNNNNGSGFELARIQVKQGNANVNSGAIQFFTGDSGAFTEKFSILSNGFVGINQPNATANLDVVGNGKFSGTVTATSFFQSSDRRLKNIIKRDGDVIYYTWKDKRDNKIHIGYIAQRVRAKNPDQVNKDDKGYLSVNYIEILVEKIRNLEKEIELLKAK
jgi:hypothetical protein